MRTWICSLGLLLSSTLSAQNPAVLAAHPGPWDNSSLGATMLFDLQASTAITITGLTTASSALPGDTHTLTIHTRSGTALGGPVTEGPGSSPAGWVQLGTVPMTQGADGISLPVQLPAIRIAAGQVVGVAVVFPPEINARYFGTGTPPILEYSDSALTLRSGDVRGSPFTAGGTFFTSRTLVGSIRYELAQPVLAAHPGPTNNLGDVGSGMFLDLQSSTGVVVNGLTTGTASAVNAPLAIDVYTRNGSALGNTAGSGPATSMTGWNLLGSVSAVQGTNLTLPIPIPDLVVPAGATIGVGLVYRNAQPVYFGSGSSPVLSFGNTNLTLVTGDALSTPFSTSTSVFSSRALVGSVYWRPIGQQMPIHPGPTNNSSGAGAGLFFDVTGPSDAMIQGFRASTSAVANSTYQVLVYTRNGTALGGTLATGPGSTFSGWILHAAPTVTQGPSGELSQPFIIPPIQLTSGQTRGIALVFEGVSPRYRGTGATAPTTYQGGLQVVSGEARSQPFTTTGSLFASRELVGTIYFQRQDQMLRNGFE